MNTIDRNTEYTVLNKNASAIFVKTRDADYAIPAGSEDAPVEWPMLFSEISYLNNTTPFFKIGLLTFEPDQEEALYDALHIRDWRSILRTDEIDDLILHPTTDGLEKVIRIQHAAYFNRVYARYIYLKNHGRAISGSVEKAMKMRLDEFQRGILVSKIQIGSVDVAAKQQAETDKRIADMQAQIEQLQAMLADRDTAPVKPKENVPKAASAKQENKPASKTTKSGTKPKGTVKQEG